MTTAVATPRATLADLARVEGKAELVAGEVIPIMATGYRPGVIALRIARRLGDYADAARRGLWTSRRNSVGAFLAREAAE